MHAQKETCHVHNSHSLQALLSPLQGQTHSEKDARQGKTRRYRHVLRRIFDYVAQMQSAVNRTTLQLSERHDEDLHFESAGLTGFILTARVSALTFARPVGAAERAIAPLRGYSWDPLSSKITHFFCLCEMSFIA